MSRYYLLLFALCPLALVQANNCVAGQFFDGTACQACPIHQYQDENGQTSCKDCTAGHYRDTNNDGVATLETSYATGSYGSGSAGSYAVQSVTNATAACKPCPAGSKQRRDSI